MKHFKQLSFLFFFSVLFSFNVFAGEDLDVQFIAVHFGDASYNEILDKSEFSNFNFYTADGDVYGYTEQQKVIGNPNYLGGWYGEIPEKMGFSANYRGKKYYGFPYAYGIIYVIDKNGTIAYQSPSTKFNSDKYDEYTGIRNAVNKVIRRARKGKEAKVLKKKKREYLKESPAGELESRKGCDIDKDEEGLTGWPVPNIKLKDENGEEIGLQDLTKGKATVLVFYTLNGVNWKKGDTDGNIKAEWKGSKLLALDQYVQKATEDFEDEADSTKSGFANAAKFVGKEAVKSIGNRKSIVDIWSAEGDLPDREKLAAYQYYLRALKFVDKHWGEK